MRAYFMRKPCTIKELKEAIGKGSGSEYIIEAVVELEERDYSYFIENLLTDFDFIAKHEDKMCVDCSKVWHCILVKAKGSGDGVLVQSEGYHYARYAAYYIGEEASL